MKLYDIVHITPTPLVGAPGKISDALQMHTSLSSVCLILNDYPGGLKEKFLANSILFSKGTEEFCIHAIANAKIVHIHNFLPSAFLVRLKNVLASSSAKLIHHAHSPLREGPVFFDFAKESSIDFDIQLAVAQYHPRQYPDAIPVPNLVLAAPSIQLIKENEKPVILFSPAHKRTGGRWNDKVSTNLEKVIEGIQQIGLAEIIYATDVHPNDLLFMRRSAHITIDEVVTGAYHQISLEGLATGNVVINNADWFSCRMLANCTESGEMPPFIRVSDTTIAEVLLELVQNPIKIAEYQRKSYDYFVKNLKPDRLIQQYENIYRKVLNDV